MTEQQIARVVLDRDGLGAARDEARQAARDLDQARVRHVAALAAIAVRDVYEIADPMLYGSGWRLVCSRCDLALTIRDDDRPAAVGPDDRHDECRRFVVGLAVDHYVARHREG